MLFDDSFFSRTYGTFFGDQCGKCSGFWFSFGDLELGRVSSQRSESGHDIAGSEYILASRLLGMSKGYMIRQDILPSLIPYIAINFVLIMRASVLASVGLMLLGLAPFKGSIGESC